MIEENDILIIGTGIAGLSLALEAAERGYHCTVVTKTELDDCATTYAQGGIAAVLDPSDSIEAHIEDTLSTGYDLSDLQAVRILAEEGPARIKKLVDWGVEFSRSADSTAWNQLDLGREGGHTTSRIAHALDRTGLVIEKALIEAVNKNPRITVHTRHTLIELITDYHSQENLKQRDCFGAYLFDRDAGQVKTCLAKHTILATGGLGAIYQYTTNPSGATGDGISAAWRAGATIANMEFMQFHPTSLYHPDADSFLITEALRGYGAILKDHKGNPFMDDYHPMKSLAPRDVVARAIDREMKKWGEPCVYLDIRHAKAKVTRERFPQIYAQCLQYGIDITRDLIPVVPASHYSCGGIKVDLEGRTDIPHLYACGEASYTGVHGANRLASNSLLEGVVFAERIIKTIDAQVAPKMVQSNTILPWDDSGTTLADEWVTVAHNRSEIQRTMSNFVGIVRNDLRLNKALKRMELIRGEVRALYNSTRVCTAILELRSMATVAEIVIKSALSRKESRGLHYTTDYPETKEELCQNTELRVER